MPPYFLFLSLYDREVAALKQQQSYSPSLIVGVVTSIHSLWKNLRGQTFGVQQQEYFSSKLMCLGLQPRPNSRQTQGNGTLKAGP